MVGTESESISFDTGVVIIFLYCVILFTYYPFYLQYTPIIHHYTALVKSVAPTGTC